MICSYCGDPAIGSVTRESDPEALDYLCWACCWTPERNRFCKSYMDELRDEDKKKELKELKDSEINDEDLYIYKYPDDSGPTN